MSSRLVTLVAPDARNRAEVARYLRRSGFEVLRSRANEGRCTMVWLTEPNSDLPEVADTISAWLAEGSRRCAIVVTMRPAAFRRSLDAARGRLLVLPAPAFGWQIVDALWAAHRDTPA